MSENDTKSTCISEMAFFNLGKIKDTLKEFRSLVLKFQQWSVCKCYKQEINEMCAQFVICKCDAILWIFMKLQYIEKQTREWHYWPDFKWECMFLVESCSFDRILATHVERVFENILFWNVLTVVTGVVVLAQISTNCISNPGKTHNKTKTTFLCQDVTKTNK